MLDKDEHAGPRPCAGLLRNWLYAHPQRCAAGCAPATQDCAACCAEAAAQQAVPSAQEVSSMGKRKPCTPRAHLFRRLSVELRLHTHPGARVGAGIIIDEAAGGGGRRVGRARSAGGRRRRQGAQLPVRRVQCPIRHARIRITHPRYTNTIKASLRRQPCSDDAVESLAACRPWAPPATAAIAASQKPAPL